MVKKISPFLVLSILCVVVLLAMALVNFRQYALASAQNKDSKAIANSFSPAPLPVSQNLAAPYVSARHAFAIDRASKTVLYQKEADARVLPASTTKMMTALVALETYPSLDQILEVPQAFPIGQNLGFKMGEKLSVEQLLYAMLVQSANDAAEILAANYSTGRIGFIEAMNQKAVQLHLVNTHFANPTGIDEESHYSSAADLARLADVGLRTPEFAKIVTTENAVVSDKVISNINQLLGKVPGVKGIKTGFTEGAGQALVTLVERSGHEVIIVVLGSDDRFGDSERLIEWVYGNFAWQELTGRK